MARERSSAVDSVATCLAQVVAEYDRAIDMISAGQVMPMNDRLRQSLARVAEEVQGALDDSATLTMGDLVMLCAAETTESFKEGADELRNNHARTLFEWSKQMFF